jgi:hypothetical protein
MIFISNYIHKYNKLIVFEDGEFFYDNKFDNVLLPNYGTYVLHNFLHKIHKIIGLSSTNIHYFKTKSGIQNNIPIMNPIFEEEDIIENMIDLELEKSDKLIISYDNDVKSIINFFHTLDIKNKKLLVFSDVFKSVDKNIIIQPSIFKYNYSFLNHGTFYITQTKKTDEYYILHLALKKGLVCVIPEYYKEFASKTITFKNTLSEVKTKIEQCNPTKAGIYKKIGQSYIRTLENQFKNLEIF